MPTTINVTAQLYDSFIAAFGNEIINLATDQLYVALVTGSYVPNHATDTYWSTPQASEASGTGYTAGGNLLTGTSWSGTVYTCDSPSWTGLSLSSVRYLVIYDKTSGTGPSSYRLVGYIDLGSAQNLSGQPLAITLPGRQLLTLLSGVSGVGGGTYSKPTGGIPVTDLTSGIQTELALAGTALQPLNGGTFASVGLGPSFNGGMFASVGLGPAFDGGTFGAETSSGPNGPITESELPTQVQTAIRLAATALQQGGNAATATKLAAARAINGVNFDGTVPITINAVDATAREPAITAGTSSQYWRGDKTMQALTADVVPDGATNKAYTATEKAKLAAISGTNTGDQTSVTGNAGTATKLATARNINGVAFDGSADISLDTHNDARYEPIEAYAVLPSAYTLVSQTAAQQLLNTTTNGAITLPVGEYFFECAFGLTAMSSTSGSFGFGFGGTATFLQDWISLAGKGATGFIAATPSITWATANQAVISVSNVNTVAEALIKGRIKVTATGTLIPQVSLGQAAAAIVNAGSFFRIQSVNSAAAFAGAWS